MTVLQEWELTPARMPHSLNKRPKSYNQQDLGIWNHLGVVVNWLLGAYGSSWGSCWGPVKCTCRKPLWKLFGAYKLDLGKLLGKLLVAYKMHLGKHLGKLLGAYKMHLGKHLGKLLGEPLGGL